MTKENTTKTRNLSIMRFICWMIFGASMRYFIARPAEIHRKHTVLAGKGGTQRSEKHHLNSSSRLRNCGFVLSAILLRAVHVLVVRKESELLTFTYVREK